MNLKKTLKWICFCFWLGLIFYLSNQSGGESQNLSNHFVLLVEQFFSVSWFSNFLVDLSFLVRKSAHFFLYFCLGIITINLLSEYSISFSRQVLFSILFCFFYACSDEIHQLFIIGRSGKILDVFLDSCGSFFGILFFLLGSYLYQKRKLKN